METIPTIRDPSRWKCDIGGSSGRGLGYDIRVQAEWMGSRASIWGLSNMNQEVLVQPITTLNRTGENRITSEGNISDTVEELSDMLRPL